MLEMVLLTPFRSVGHCLSFYNNANPARLKSINLLEAEGRSSPNRDDFSGESPVDLYASVTLGIGRVLKCHCSDAVLAFGLRNFGDRQHQQSVEDIAKLLRRSTNAIYRYLNKIHDDLENEFARRELIEITTETTQE